MNVGSGIALARALGPEARGQVAIALLWGPLLAGLGGLGVAEAVTYYSSRESFRRSASLAPALVVGLIQSAVLTVIGFLILPLILSHKPGHVLDLALAYLVVVPLFPLTFYPLAVLQGRAIGDFNRARIVVHTVYTVLLSVLWGLGRLDVATAVGASIAANILSCIITCYLVWIRGYATLRPASWAWRPLLSFGWRLHIGNVGYLISQRIDVAFLSVLVATAVVGHYSVALAAASTMSLVPTAVSLLLYPAISRDSELQRGRRLARLLLWGGSLTVVLAPAAVVAMPFVVPIVFGDPFKPSSEIAQVLLIGFLFRGWAAMLTAVIRGAGRPLASSIGDLIGLTTMVALLLILIRIAGGLGAATAVTCAAAVQVGWLLVQSFRSTGLSFTSMVDNWMSDLRAIGLHLKLGEVKI